MKKTSSQWNNQFSMGVVCFSNENSINLIGTCLEILQCPTYVHDKAGTLLLLTLSPFYYCSVYFCHTMMLAATGSYRHHCYSVAQSKRKDLIYRSWAMLPMLGLGRFLWGGK